MNDNNIKKIWLLSIFILLIIISFLLINRVKVDDSYNGLSNNNSYEIVRNYSKFYTVNSCISRYLAYLQSENTSSLLKVLDDDFILSNGINESNIYNHLNLYEGNINFNSKKMYEENVTDNIKKYYVFGYVEKDVMNKLPEKIEAYFLVNLDEENSVFTIQPYSGEIFK